MYNEIMESINRIDSTIMEAEVNVASVLVDAYSKAAMIMEYAGDTDVETFGIIQECFIVEGAKYDAFKDKYANKKSILAKMIRGLINMIDGLLRFIKTKFSKLKHLKNVKNEQVYISYDISKPVEKMIKAYRDKLNDTGQYIDLLRFYVQITKECLSEINRPCELSLKPFDNSIKIETSYIYETMHKLLCGEDGYDDEEGIYKILSDVEEELHNMIGDEMDLSASSPKENFDTIRENINNLSAIVTHMESFMVKIRDIASYGPKTTYGSEVKN